MIEGTDFSLPEGQEEGDPSGAPTPPPVIVIEYRNRGLATRLMPPLLILIVAVAISSYQRRTPSWPQDPRRPWALAPAPAPRPSDPRATPPATGVVSPTKVSPAPPPSSPAAPVASRDSSPASAGTGHDTGPSPFDNEASEGLRPLEPVATLDTGPPPDRPGEAAGTAPPVVGESLTAADAVKPIQTAPGENPAAPPAKPVEPSEDEILRDIQREAQLKDAKRHDLEGLKANAEALLFTEALAQVHASRLPFLEELRQTLRERGDDAGPKIKELSERFGKEPLPEVKRAYIRALRTLPNRMARREKVELLRTIGMPEPLILDQLCHEFDRLVNTRGGPRTQHEVRVRAARALLSLPPPKQPPVGPGSSGPQPSARRERTRDDAPVAHAANRPVSRVRDLGAAPAR